MYICIYFLFRLRYVVAFEIIEESPESIVNLKTLQGRECICVNLEAHDRPWIHIKRFLHTPICDKFLRIRIITAVQ